MNRRSGKARTDRLRLERPALAKTTKEARPILLKATRARVAMIMLIPVTLGAALAWLHTGAFQVGLWLLTVIGTVLLHLASNVTNDLGDYRRGTDVAARARSDAVATDSGALTGGLLSERQMKLLNFSLYGLAVAIALYLFWLRGWPILALTGAGILLAVLYVMGPAYGYIGHGLGELGIFLAFGPLPLVGSYLVQTGTASWPVFLASVPPGLYITLILFNHHFLHWQNDREQGKNNLVAVLGAKRAAPISLGLLLAAYASIPLVALLGALPWLSVVACLTLPVTLPATRALVRNPGVAEAGRLMGATFRGQMLTGLLVIASVFASGWL